jgi:predicted short-subunit dehydrogenase-like oxidoreductase (DUF2520 family)
VQADRILVPGRCRADLDRLSADFGVRFERGPEELKDLPAYFGKHGRGLDLSRQDMRIFAEIVDASALTVDAIVARAQEKSRKKAAALAQLVGARAIVEITHMKADVVWFCVPDSDIANAAADLANNIPWQGKIGLHSSGALTSDELSSLRTRGAAVASVHPLMTFVEASRPGLAGVAFAVEGDPVAVRVARKMVRQLGGHAYPIRKQDKAAYHAWGTFASPLLTALLAPTEQVAKLAGVQGKDARRRMIPILSQTLANYAELGAARGFSGPIIRGDVEIVKRHLRVLRESPPTREVYVALVRAAVQYLPAKNKAALRRLLKQ